MNMIKFENFFKMSNPANMKVKFNMYGGNPNKPAWDYLMDDNEQWLSMNSWKTKQPNNNFGHATYLLAFAQYYPYGPNYFIFGGLYKIDKIIPEVWDKQGYNLTLLDDFKEYRKRLIIKLQKPIGRNNYNRWFEHIQDTLNPEIYELTHSSKLGTFPGYNNVLLSHEKLQLIVRNEEPEWKNALSIVKGIYCITDSSNGKLYIGAAYGDSGGIWQRWSQYANKNNLTGGNKTFKELKDIDNGYIIDNFTYSILEIFDMKTKNEIISQREQFWIRVFKTKEYGMNN